MTFFASETFIFREPLVSPDGYLFDKESILTYILEQKNEYKRKLKVWEQQCKIDQEKQQTVSSAYFLECDFICAEA